MLSELIPAWITAVGAVAAVGAAGTVFRVDLSERRRTDRESQARLFDAWIALAMWEQHPQDDRDQYDPGPVELQVDVHVSNASGQSMRGVDVSVMRGESALGPLRMLHVIPATVPGSPVMRRLWIQPSEGPAAATSLRWLGAIHEPVATGLSEMGGVRQLGRRRACALLPAPLEDTAHVGHRRVLVRTGSEKGWPRTEHLPWSLSYGVGNMGESWG